MRDRMFVRDPEGDLCRTNQSPLTAKITLPLSENVKTEYKLHNHLYEILRLCRLQV